MTAIDSYLKKRGSPMAGLGKDFEAAGARYGVDPRLLVGIAVIESGAGQHMKNTNNPFNWGVHSGKTYPTLAASIDDVARGLAKHYIGEGLTTPQQIVSKYAPGADNNNESNWASVVSEVMHTLGGAPVKTDNTILSDLAKKPTYANPAPLIDFEGERVPGRTGAAPSLAMALMSGNMGLFTKTLRARRAARESDDLAQIDPTWAPPITNLAPEGPNPWYALRTGADREGVTTHAPVLDFVAQVAQRYGKPLTIGTGTAHNQYVVGTNRESDHWTGWAADIPATGMDLTRLGQAALVAAGAEPAWARRQKGGVFNINGKQILFNTRVGGNHYNHLHVGLRDHG